MSSTTSPGSPSRRSASTRRLRAASALIVAGVLGAACGNSSPAASPDGGAAPPPPASSAPAGSASTGAVALDVKDFLFAPKTVSVAVGTTVTWTNQDRFGHTATSGAPRDETGTFDIVMGMTTDKDTTGLGGSHTFTEAGTFEYFCRYHPSMVGTITVT